MDRRSASSEEAASPGQSESETLSTGRPRTKSAVRSGEASTVRKWRRRGSASGASGKQGLSDGRVLRLGLGCNPRRQISTRSGCVPRKRARRGSQRIEVVKTRSEKEQPWRIQAKLAVLSMTENSRPR